MRHPAALAAALAAVMMTADLPAHAQSSGSGGGGGGSAGGGQAGGSSGSARTQQAPSGSLERGPGAAPRGGSPTMGGGTGESSRLGTPGGGTAPGSSMTPGQPQQSRVPDMCTGPADAPNCEGMGDPTGSLGDRGISPNQRPYGPDQSPVQGGPSFDGPTGRPLDLPREGR